MSLKVLNEHKICDHAFLYMVGNYGCSLIKPLIYLALILQLSFSGYGHTKNNTEFDIFVNAKFSKETTGNRWFSVIKKPASPQQYFAGEASGNIYTLNLASPQPTSGDNIYNPQKLLNVKQYAPSLISLTAFTLHPNFHLEEKHGHLVLYTAHIETRNQNIKTSRIKNSDEHLPFEAVLTEWQLQTNNDLSLTIKSDSYREVLRIPTPSEPVNISQLLFNPYVKPWQENYAMLYMVLSADPQHLTSPLFSGSILKINPDKFGSRSYSIPQSNPFIIDKSINNEIINTGLGQINSLSWSKESHHYFLINLVDEEQKSSFYQLAIGDDWRDKSSTPKSFYQSQSTTNSNSVLYRGKEINGVRSQLLHLTLNDEQWQLISVSIKAPFQNKQLAVLPKNVLPSSAQPFLFIDHQNELAIFDKSSQSLFSISPSKSALNNQEAETELTQASQAQAPQSQTSVNTVDEQSYFVIPLLLFVLLLMIIAVALLKFGYNGHLAKLKKLLHKQYAKYEVDLNNKTIKLYKRHQSHVDLTIKLEEIEQSEIFLNDQLINTINTEQHQHFSSIHEKHILYHIDLEKREKMIDHKTRKIELVIQDLQQHKYFICVYLREGNQRLTKAKFDEVINALIDWCWLISATINPYTPKREVLETALPQDDTKTKNDVIVQPSTPDNIEQSTPVEIPADLTENSPLNDDSSAKNFQQIEDNQTGKTATETVKDKCSDNISSNVAITANDSQNDIELINALDKLAKLKQQGLLTNDEFTEAKVKIINKLT